MPGRNGSGPMGLGPMTGRGLGVCSGKNMIRGAAGLGAGLMMARQGFGRRGLHRGAQMAVGLCQRMGLGRRGWRSHSTTDASPANTRKELLEEKKALLESRLTSINKQLDTL